MNLGTRRVLLVIISLGVGVGFLFGVFAFLNLVYNANVGFHNYAPVYVIFTILPMALFAAIWLDYFLKTDILKEGPVEEES